MAPDEKEKQPEQLLEADDGSKCSLKVLLMKSHRILHVHCLLVLTSHLDLDASTNASAAAESSAAANPSGSAGPSATPDPSATAGPSAPTGPARPPAPPGLEPLPAPARLSIPPPALSSWPPAAPVGAQAPPRPATGVDVRAALANPAMDYFRQLLFQTPNLGDDFEQYNVIADMYNELHIGGTIVDAVLYLEAAYWNFGQALEDWARDDRLRTEHLNGNLTEDEFNSRLDRSNARGGDRFETGKLTPVVKTKKGEVRADFDHANFDHNNPRDILRLNRQRQEFFDRTIGALPCPPKGREGEWWHDLEKWEVERRYVLKDRNGEGFPGWINMADDHNRGFKNRRLPGLLEPPPHRAHNKITQHINRSALNKHKDKGQERHKLAQAGLDTVHQKRRQALQDAWDKRFSSTLEDIRILNQEDAFGRMPGAADASKIEKDDEGRKAAEAAAKAAAKAQEEADEARDAANILLNLYDADQRETRSKTNKGKGKMVDKGKGKAKESDEEDDEDAPGEYDDDY